eukprot:3069038-Amphidinium_carterae.1
MAMVWCSSDIRSTVRVSRSACNLKEGTLVSSSTVHGMATSTLLLRGSDDLRARALPLEHSVRLYQWTFRGTRGY